MNDTATSPEVIAVLLAHGGWCPVVPGTYEPQGDNGHPAFTICDRAAPVIAPNQVHVHNQQTGPCDGSRVQTFTGAVVLAKAHGTVAQ